MNANPAELDGRTTALTALALAMLVALVVAWRVDAVATSVPPDNVCTITVVDETGNPLPGATMTNATIELTTDETGSVVVELNAPELFIVTAGGKIADVVVVGGPDQTEVTVSLLDKVGPSGPRTVMHFGGDFMLGRRYQEPEDDRTATAIDAESARSIVADIAPLFSLADLSSVNFESVIGNLSEDNAYPGKRFLLQSPPYSIAALEELGVDVVALGNNHVNDWLEAGIASTIRHLDAARIAHAGGGLTAAEAVAPALIETPHATIGMVSMTTVDGDYVNDHLPSATATMPASLPVQEHWQYELRTFGFGSEGDTTYIPAAARRPGPMWGIFTELEETLPAGDAADLWQSVIRTYPELQDWVARRGHGGAAHFSASAVASAIGDARDQGADLVVVQLHAGMQFAEVGSEFLRRAARIAVDEGADLVVGHHPHVLQGFEFYNDVLIVHSLGNIVFDQDFFVTHPSLILRTVFEGETLVAAKLYPVMIDGYRPVLVGGSIADQVLTKANLASLQPGVATRLPDLRVGIRSADTTSSASIDMESGIGMVVPGREPQTLVSQLEAGVPAPSPAPLIEITSKSPPLHVGRDLFGFGDLEDATTDGSQEGGLAWVLPPDSLEIDVSSPAGPWTVRLDRTSQHLEPIIARTGARLPIPEHRWYDGAGVPLDGPAAYSVRLWGKRVGSGSAFLRLSFYEFDDTDPTRQPQSTALETIDVDIPLVDDGEWHELWIELPPAPGAANAALVGVGLAPPESQSGTVWIDGLRVIEWRHASRLPVGSWAQADYLRSSNTGAVELVTP